MAPPAYPPQKNSARSGPREHSASIYTKCTRFDILAVLDTCTTVASRVATNACATHLRFLTKPQTPSGLASSPLRRQRGPGVVMTYNNRLSSTNHDSLRFPRVLSSSRVSRGHIIHAHLTYGNPGEHTEVDSHKPFPQMWRLKPTNTPVSPPGTTPGLPAGDYPHTPVSPPGTSHPRRGAFPTNTPPR
jgi:hypothetical protein